MRIDCEHCGSIHNIPDERLENLGDHIVFPCPKCQGRIEVDLRDEKEAAVPPSSSPSTASADLTGQDLKDRILKTVNDLPPMPQVAQKAREIITKEDWSYKDLAEVIEADQAIASRVLKIANSAYYGISGQVSSIQKASVILGRNTLNELLTLACAESVLGSELKGYQQQSDDIWKRSLAVVMGAKSLAQRRHPDLAEDAFSAGLLHDCGKLILDQYILERTDQFESFVDQGEVSFLEAEQHILGFDHAEIAAEVCEKWSISGQLATAIRYHHRPLETEARELTYIVHAADAISMMSGLGAGIDGMMYKLDDQVLSFLELDEELIATHMIEIIRNVEKAASKI